ncbi:MAG: glycosyl hydrolase, partial [Chloroflexi bacterium]|nr:glycosyl hydrolase [Chloroflexota bacterium]
MEFRHMGPYRGGRVVAVTGHPTERHVYWFGSTGGGVWKTEDAGDNWENVSDGFFKRASVGAIAIAPSDPNVLYVGMGEATIRNTASHGDGVYRSTDGGATWTHLGLAETQHVGKIRVHPRDPDTAFVAALGHASGPNPERGLFRTRDGGTTWKKVLDRGVRAGAVDVSIDLTNPRIVYASVWETQRAPWVLTSGGPGSGLFRSDDGGDTWTEISRSRGFAAGVLGKIGVAVSPARTGRVWAIVEAEEGGLYRSEDGGGSWTRVNGDEPLWRRSFYYQHVVADPVDADTVWVLNTDFYRSTDGGRTFGRVAMQHGDVHDLWIDALDTRRMILGTDGGAAVTFNGGTSWSRIDNQPTAELYHLATDTRTPYHVYAAQQDCGTIELPSRSILGAITTGEQTEVGGGEGAQIAVRPDDPNIVFASDIGGFLSRFDMRTGQARNIEVWPEPQASQAGGRATKHRFTWCTPLALSPHDPGVLYVGGERMFRSDDEGSSWRAISPDLTRRDPRGMAPSTGRITRDRPTEDRDQVCTIFAFAESPVREGVIWTGSDDGFVHLTRDGGKTWKNVTPKSFAAWTLVTTIEPSPHDAATAYLTATRYLLDDFRPIVLRTNDWGRTWSPITAGIDSSEPARVVREDPERRGLLFCGTEAGAYVSFDDGGEWHRFRGLPAVPVHDMQVKEGDLVLATHGRGFWA